MSALPVIILLMTTAVAAVAWQRHHKNSDSEQLLEMRSTERPSESKALRITRERSVQNALTLWSDGWELNPTLGRVRFRVRNCKSGLIIALANEWKKTSAGGIAVVLRDPLSAPMQNSEHAVLARNRSYFAVMPYLNRPAFHSTSSLNHEIRPYTNYEVAWNEKEIRFSREGEGLPLLRFDRVAESSSFQIRYLAFGIFGAEKLSCEEEFSEIDNVRILK